jgi:hypothetical protein
VTIKSDGLQLFDFNIYHTPRLTLLLHPPSLGHHENDLSWKFTNMNFTHSQQAFTQQQQIPSSGPINGQHLTSLPPHERATIYQQYLVQQTPISILPNGSFSKLQSPLASSLHLTNPHSQNDTLALEASQTFYSLNTFAISITTLPSFLSWTLNTNPPFPLNFKPSSFITCLAILYGPPTSPGGGNEELRGLLQLPNLRNLRLIFQDYEFKGLGPQYWLRPSLSVIDSLASLPHLSLTLQLGICLHGLDGRPEDLDTEDVRLRDVTSYLRNPSEEEERVVREMYRVIEGYRGPRASFEGILCEMGWSESDARKVVGELSPRVAVNGWREEERRRGLGEVEMSGG